MHDNRCDGLLPGIRADDFSATDRVQAQPDWHADAVLDEPDRAVAEQEIDPARMAAAWAGVGTLIARSAGAG